MLIIIDDVYFVIFSKLGSLHLSKMSLVDTKMHFLIYKQHLVLWDKFSISSRRDITLPFCLKKMLFVHPYHKYYRLGIYTVRILRTEYIKSYSVIGDAILHANAIFTGDNQVGRASTQAKISWLSLEKYILSVNFGDRLDPSELSNHSHDIWKVCNILRVLTLSTELYYPILQKRPGRTAWEFRRICRRMVYIWKISSSISPSLSSNDNKKK